MLYYCKKCGRILLLFDKYEKICDYCKNIVFPIPEQFLCSEYSINEELKEKFINEYVRTSSEFDQYLFDAREKNAMQHINDFKKQSYALEHGKAILEEQMRTPKCPSCGSSNISKVGVVGRAVSFKLVGFASSKIGKTHKCNNCGSMW